MATTERTRRFLRGVGSVIDLSPVGGRVERARLRCVRPAPDASGYVFAPPGVRHSENLSLAGVLAWAECLARHPQAVEANPAAVDALRTVLDEAAETPPIVHQYSPVGNRWIDAVKLAEDRYRVRQRLVVRGRQLLEQITAARPDRG